MKEYIPYFDLLALLACCVMFVDLLLGQGTFSALKSVRDSVLIVDMLIISMCAFLSFVINLIY